MSKHNGEPTIGSLPPSRKLSAIGLFAALALVINISRISMPAPYAPTFLTYEIWEIPIVVALIMFGINAAVSVSLINVVALLLIQPGALPSGPFYNLAATLTMFVGVVAGNKIINRIGKGPVTVVSCSTILGILTRTAGMTLFNAIFLPFPPPIGFSVSGPLLTSYLVLIAVFNSTLALYTIPISYWIVKALLPRYRFSIAFPFGVNRLEQEQKLSNAPTNDKD